jgi:hypothetical protein
MYDSWTSCVSVDNNRMVLGDGLKQGMFDACLNALPTIERIHFAKFSLPYSKEATYNVYLNSDDTEPEDFTGLNVGFVKGWSADERCFQRCYGKALDKAQVKYVTGPADLSSMLNDGQIDLFMSIGKDHYKEVDEGKLKVARTCQCTLGDVSVIERKDSRFSDEVWNIGFPQIILNGLYGELCKKWGQENVAPRPTRTVLSSVCPTTTSATTDSRFPTGSGSRSGTSRSRSGHLPQPVTFWIGLLHMD